MTTETQRSKEQTGYFLSDAKRIIQSPILPSKNITDVSIHIVHTPDNNAAILGPIFASSYDKRQKGDVEIYIKGGYDHIPHIKNKLIAAENNPDRSYRLDPYFPSAGRMVKKNNFSWESLCNASRMSKGWSDLSFGALGESISQTISHRSITYPTTMNNLSAIITNLCLMSEKTIDETGIHPLIVKYLSHTEYRKKHLGNMRKSQKKLQNIEDSIKETIGEINTIFSDLKLSTSEHYYSEHTRQGEGVTMFALDSDLVGTI